MLGKFCKHSSQIGQLVGIFIQYMFLSLQCLKPIIPESLFIPDLSIAKICKKKTCYYNFK